MSQLAVILGRYAPGHALDHEGKQYVFARIDQKTKAALEGAYFKRAREAIYAIKLELTPQQVDHQLTHVTDAYRRGQFAFPMGEAGRYFMGEGLPELVTHLTGCTAGEADALVRDRGHEVAHLCLCVVTESFPNMKAQLLANEKLGDGNVLNLIRQLSMR